ncbi:DUF3139 domain-containing protein [Staphylococcus auricularis]|uniref:DUF3139 domain-containing protein n=1 Tax=Staphylococcus auricularis TaxID=29379 RepID=UPI00242A5E04|nr:DUF3139 domain-containing protein [Staphylococcus auricularis]
MKKVLKITLMIVIILTIIISLFCLDRYMYQKHKEEKIQQEIHQIFKQKGWEDKVKSEENMFSYNTGYNYYEVVFKDEPYNVYQYYYDDDNKIVGDAFLNLPRNAKKPKNFKESYDIK